MSNLNESTLGEMNFLIFDFFLAILILGDTAVSRQVQQQQSELCQETIHLLLQFVL